MKSLKNIVASLVVVAGLFLVACSGDDSSSASPRDEDSLIGLSSSVATSSSERSAGDPSSSNTDKGSSSSEIAANSSSSRNDNSSSSVKSSSSSAMSSSSAGNATPCKTETEDDCEYETLTDDRDGKVYKTVKIGDQWWMAENLNYETANSNCYKDSASYCEKYGRLYTWAAAMDSAGTWGVNGKDCGYGWPCWSADIVRGVCPEGWHLPSQTEWNTLFTAVGGSSIALGGSLTDVGLVLKSRSGWNDSGYDTGGNGTDDFGFSAIPAGYRGNNGIYYYEGNYANFWSSTEDGSINVYYVYLYYFDDYAYLLYNKKNYGYSVRCLKD